MNRAFSLMMVLLTAGVALPAAAQESGGLRLGNNPLATLGVIEANRGCPLSSTSVTVGINKSFGTGSAATQRLGTVAGATGSSGCRPLVATQVAVGVNLALGSGSQAGQSISVQGQRGALDTVSFTRGVNEGIGAGSLATQRIQNLTGR
jgi:hypothetical protein